MTAREITDLVECLHGDSDEQRFALLSEAANNDDLKRRLHEAHVVLAAAGVDNETREAGTSMVDEAALALSRGKVSREAVADWEDVEWLLASLGAVEPSTTAKPRASTATRRSMQAVTGAPQLRFRRRIVWFPALGGLAAAAILTVVMALPAGEPWARSLELSRWRVFRMETGFQSGVQDALQGRLTAPLFEPPGEPTRRERDAIAAGLVVPVLIHPRWEAVAVSRPEFRWSSGEDDFAVEVILVDEQRKIVWSAETTASEGLIYPADQVELSLGATYYWKVNRLGGDRLVASPYAGFRVLDDESSRRLDAELRSAAEHPFLLGCAYDRQGLYTAALEAFERAAGQAELRDAAMQAQASIRSKQGRTP